MGLQTTVLCESQLVVYRISRELLPLDLAAGWRWTCGLVDSFRVAGFILHLLVYHSTALSGSGSSEGLL